MATRSCGGVDGVLLSMASKLEIGVLDGKENKMGQRPGELGSALLMHAHGGVCGNTTHACDAA